MVVFCAYALQEEEEKELPVRPQVSYFYSVLALAHPHISVVVFFVPISVYFPIPTPFVFCRRQLFSCFVVPPQSDVLVNRSNPYFSSSFLPVLVKYL